MHFQVFDLGLIDYRKAWDFQKHIFQKAKNGSLKFALILCRHTPVVTLGKSASKENILTPIDKLKGLGINVYEVERGGDVTYHGPGQFMVYPVFNLNYLKKDIHWFLRFLESIALNVLSSYYIYCQRRIGLTGVWYDSKKIASIGIAIKNWVTFHGMSINIARQDTINFKHIKPCGMDIQMTSVEEIINKDVGFEELKALIISKTEEALCQGTPLATAGSTSLDWVKGRPC